MDATKRTRVCAQCGSTFSYQIKQGSDRKLCSKACAWQSRKAAMAAALHTLPACSVSGCESPANRVGAGLCEKHHARLRRLGKHDLPAKPEEIPQSAGYRLSWAPGHPLATSSQRSRVYTHRKVYYDAHGAGPFNCYHCGAHQTWETMHVDHLDDDVTNNAVSNLAASCPTCNTKRGMHKMIATSQAKGTWVEYGNVSLPLRECAKLIGLSPQALRSRLQKLPIHLALLTRPGPTAGPRDMTKRYLPKKPKRVVNTYTRNGLTMTLREWAEHLGLKPKYLAYMIATHGPVQGLLMADPAKQRTVTADLSHRSRKG